MGSASRECFRYWRKIVRQKFGNRKTGAYDSKREAKLAAELKLLERAGEISQLKEQVTFLLLPAQYIDGKCVERKVTYTADFTFRDKQGRLRVQDSKGYPNDRWPLKRKMMLYFHQIKVEVV